MSTKKTGLDALLTPQDSVLLLIDHQPFQFANLHSHEPTMVINNVVGLAKIAKAFDVPTILTTVVEERGGYIIQGLQDVFPDQKPINRTTLNTWEDARVVDAVKAARRKKLIIAGLYTEICVAMPAIHALDDGYTVYAVTAGVFLRDPDPDLEALPTLAAAPVEGGLVVLLSADESVGVCDLNGECR